MTNTTAYPLSWPLGWKRTPISGRARSRFGNHSLAQAAKEALTQLARMDVGDWNVVISTNVALRLDGLPLSNQKAPEDPGVAVYFKLKNQDRVLACDRWDRVEHNLWAIAKHVEAIRAQDRYGVGTVEQAFAGYAALPDPERDQEWHGVLAFALNAQLTRDDIETRYRELVKRHHPDKGGDAVTFDRIVKARAAALAAIGAA